MTTQFLLHHPEDGLHRKHVLCIVGA
jgi:hypothetical protein